MPITYLRGDATSPVGEGNKLIVHVCNDVGAWGAGFVMAISRKWNGPEQAYRIWFEHGGVTDPPFELSQVQCVPVEHRIWVCNMIAQSGVTSRTCVPPIRYGALKDCLRRVADIALQLNASIHMPRIGCGLAGGTWDVVGKIVEQELGDLNVTVYDLP